MTIYFTADTHFGHKNIINLCKRPFCSVEEMDEWLIKLWNERVGILDTVYHLGDVSLSHGKRIDSILERLNGTIHLVYGNHDRKEIRRHPRFASSNYVLEIKHGGHDITLCHYAFRTWNGSTHGSLMLHGHSHGLIKPSRQSIDVGVDAGWQYQPTTLRDILKKLNCFPKKDVNSVNDFEVI